MMPARNNLETTLTAAVSEEVAVTAAAAVTLQQCNVPAAAASVAALSVVLNEKS